MKVKDLLVENENDVVKPLKPIPSLSEEMKKFYSVIENFERTGKIRREDKIKIDTLKDFISNMVKTEEDKKL
jgi:hypothetical protein